MYICTCKSVQEEVLQRIEIVVFFDHPMNGFVNFVAGNQCPVEEDDLDLSIFGVEGEDDVFIRP